MAKSIEHDYDAGNLSEDDARLVEQWWPWKKEQRERREHEEGKLRFSIPILVIWASFVTCMEVTWQLMNQWRWTPVEMGLGAWCELVAEDLGILLLWLLAWGFAQVLIQLEIARDRKARHAAGSRE